MYEDKPFFQRTEGKLVIGLIGLFVGLFILIIMFPIVVIGAGERGVVFNNATGIENRVLGEGVHFRIPLVQSVHSLSIKVQKNDVKAEAASKDLQTVSTDIVVNWHLDASQVNKIFQNIGDEKAVLDRIINPAVNEVVKAATAQKTAEEVLTKRAELKADIDQRLDERLSSYGVMLDDVSIVDVNFSQEFNKAIEQKQVAEQDARKAKFQADQKVEEARGEVEKAKGVAEAQRLVQQTLTPELLQKLAIEKWDGKVPTVAGGGQGFIFNLPNVILRP